MFPLFKRLFSTFLFMAVTLFVIPMQAMDPSESTGSVLLEGKLKPIAATIERNLERYQKFEESNPKMADAALKGSMIMAKGVLFAGAGAISGASAGPAGSVIMGGEGFIVGIQKGVVDEIRSAIMRPITGEAVEALVNKGIDALAPKFLKLDRSLDEHESKILAASVIAATLSAAEFKCVSKGMLKSAVLGLSPHRALLKNFTEDPGATLYKLSRTHMKPGNLVHQGLHGSMGVVSEASRKQLVSLDGHQMAGSRQAPVSVATEEQNAQFLQEASEFFVPLAQENVQEGLKESLVLMQLEKSPDQKVAAQQIQARLTANNADQNYELYRATFADSCEGLSSIASIMGNHKTAAQIAGLGHASIRLMDSCHMLSVGSTAAGLSKGSVLSPIAPYVGIVSAVSSLMSLFQDDDTDSTRVILQQMRQMYEALSKQIDTVYIHMMERFDGLEGKVDQLHLHMIRGFLGMAQQLRDFSVSSLYSFERIGHELQELHEINAKADALLLRPFIQACSAIALYQRRFDSLESMDEKEAVAHYQALENGILGIDPTYNYLNGYVCFDFSPITMNRILTLASPEALLGYLAKYMLDVASTAEMRKDIDARSLPNLKVFMLGLERYLALRQNTTQISYDSDGEVLQRIGHVGAHALKFIESVQTNKELFEKLIAGYSANYEKVLALFNQALDKKSEEVLAAVHSNAVKVNEERSKTFPGFFHPDPRKRNMSFWKILTSCMEPKYGPELQVPVLQAVEWIAQNKFHFKAPITLPQKTLLTNPDNTALNAVVSCPNDTRFIPLNFREKANILEKNIPMEAIIAERLGLGVIEFDYSGTTPQLALNIVFRKKDKTVLQLGTAHLIASQVTLPTPRRDKTMDRLLNELESDSLLPWVIRSCWENATLTSWTPVAQTTTALSTLIDERLVQLRKEALATLSDTTTELGTRYKQAVEALDASHNLVKAFGTIAGFGAVDTQALMNKHLLDSHHTRYLANASETTNPLPESQEGVIAAISSIVSRRATSNPMDNSFSQPLRIMLAKLGHFAQNYHEIVQQRPKEMPHYKQTKKEVFQQQKIESLEKSLAEIKVLLQQLKE